MRFRSARHFALGILFLGVPNLASAAAPLPPPRPVELGRAAEEPAPPPSEPAGEEGRAAPSDLPWPKVGSWRLRPLQTSPEFRPPGEEPPPSVVFAPPVATPPPAAIVHLPLPPRRPTALGGIAPLESDPEAFADAGGCMAKLRAAGAVFVPAGQPGGNPACGIDNPVRLSGIAERSAPGGTIALPDRPVISCRLALRFGEWIRSVAPVLSTSRNAALASITTGPGWECRGRNRRAGGKLSAHGNGLALDINTFFFANKARLPVRGHAGDPAFAAIRRAACTAFTTVLGPGSDGYHEDHLHLDILRHGRDGKYRLCR